MLDQFNSFLAGAEDVPGCWRVVSRGGVPHIHGQCFLVHVFRVRPVAERLLPQPGESVAVILLRGQGETRVRELDVPDDRLCCLFA